jgi:SAM-dependent methyltransferase
MKDHNNHKYKKTFQGFWHQLLQIDLIRHFIVATRFFYFTKIVRKLKTYDVDTGGVSSNTISHNLKGIRDHAATRPLALIKPLSVIESLSKEAKILTIGPRSEGELFSLVGYGFLPKNIQGLDLISFSPWVDLGDMHKMPYEDNSFDVVVLGWVIAYSDTPEIAAKEVVRVLKNGGIVAIGVEHGGEEAELQKKEMGYTPGSGRFTNHVDQFLVYFGDHINDVYFTHNILPERMHLKGSVLSIFSIKK